MALGMLLYVLLAKHKDVVRSFDCSFQNLNRMQDLLRRVFNCQTLYTLLRSPEFSRDQNNRRLALHWLRQRQEKEPELLVLGSDPDSAVSPGSSIILHSFESQFLYLQSEDVNTDFLHLANQPT